MRRLAARQPRRRGPPPRRLVLLRDDAHPMPAAANATRVNQLAELLLLFAMRRTLPPLLHAEAPVDNDKVAELSAQIPPSVMGANEYRSI